MTKVAQIFSGWRTKHIPERDVLIVCCILLFFFLLQARYLHLAVRPITDEGVYAEAGRMMFQRLMPHKDFPLWHMPLLSFLMGGGLKVFGNMYSLRILYLLLNYLAVIPLYLTFKKISRDTAPAILAILFYLMFHEMVHHDFRFIAIRQFANVLFILFFYLSVCHKDWKRLWAAQGILTVASAFLFLPAFCNLVLLMGALTCMEKPPHVWRVLERYSKIILATSILILLYFFLVPQSVDQVIFTQMMRNPISWAMRTKLLFAGKFDSFFYILSIVSLTISACVFRHTRWLALCMLGIFAINVYLPSGYYPHYTSIAGPALAFGMLMCGMLLAKFYKYIVPGSSTVFFTTLILLFCYQFSLVYQSLAAEWLDNRQPEYFFFISKLKESPGPILCLEPIYAVDAQQTLLHAPMKEYLRSPENTHVSSSQWSAMTLEACTIVMESKLKQRVPLSVQQEWMATFDTSFSNKWGTILLIRSPHCQNGTKAL